MEQYLIDTNVVSDYFSDSLPEAGIQLMNKIIDATPIFSIITQIELLCWNTNSAAEKNIRDFIDDSLVINITDDVITHCVRLRKGKKIKTPDAIIAATALALDYILITNNEKDFAHIKNLKFINPHNI